MKLNLKNFKEEKSISQKQFKVLRKNASFCRKNIKKINDTFSFKNKIVIRKLKKNVINATFFF